MPGISLRRLPVEIFTFFVEGVNYRVQEEVDTGVEGVRQIKPFPTQLILSGGKLEQKNHFLKVFLLAVIKRPT
jgi:hypothetical protein